VRQPRTLRLLKNNPLTSSITPPSQFALAKKIANFINAC